MTVDEQPISPPTVPLTVRRRLPGLSDWRAPVHRDGFALVLSSALTSLMGLGYWVLVARLFPPDVVGVNQVVLSTMMLIGGVAHLNMTYALLRFVPVAGRASRRLVAAGYLVAVLIASLAGGAFALGAQLWSPELLEAVGHGRLIVFFMVASPVWAIFTVQDYVLTAIGAARVVPVENSIFALVKIGMLLLAAWATLQGGIAISWVVSTALVVLVMNLWLFLRALPAHSWRTAGAAVPITVGAIGRYVRGDYAGAVFWQAAMLGIPSLVLARLDAAAAATYGIVWQIGLALFLVPSGMGQAVVAHGAADPDGIEAARRAMIRKSLTLLVPAVVVLVVAGRWVLEIFGSVYAETGALPLALIALASLANVLTAATVSAARVRQRMGVLFGVPATAAMLVIVLAWLLMPHLGVTGVGLAWLIGQSVVGAGILVANAPWLPPLLSTRVDTVRSNALLRRVVPAALRSTGLGDTTGWTVHDRLAGGSESVVVTVGPAGAPAALLKACDTPRSRADLRHQTEVLTTLHTDPRVAHWIGIVPSVLGQSEVGGSYCVLESLLPGEPGTAALRDPLRSRVFSASALTVIGELHRATARAAVVGDDLLQHWVHGPMEKVIGVLPRLREDATALAARLDRRMRGRRLPVGWMHGDFGPVNTLTDATGRLTGVVDWCDADERGLPVLDVMVFLHLSRVIADGEELGSIVLRWLRDGLPAEADLLRRAQRGLGGDALDPSTLALLGWLHHVSTVIAKSREFASNPVWLRRNVRSVLRSAGGLLGDSDEPGTGAALRRSGRSPGAVVSPTD